MAGDLAATGDGDDAQPDTVVANAGDSVTVTAAGPDLHVSGLAARLSVSGAIAGSDRLIVNALDGSDVVDASGVAADSALLTLDGGDRDDVLTGGDGADVFLGGEGDHVLLGGPGNDTLDGGPGDNVVLQGLRAGTARRSDVLRESENESSVFWPVSGDCGSPPGCAPVGVTDVTPPNVRLHAC